MANDPLSALKDIHQPPPISWWPLAPGWYLLIGLAILLLVLFFVWRHKHRQKRLKHQHIKQQWLHIRQKVSQQDPTTVSDLSKLMRRVVLIHYPRSEVAGLVGDEWLLFLDRTIQTKQFSEGPGRLLLTAAYQQQWDDQTEELVRLIEGWMKRCLK